MRMLRVSETFSGFREWYVAGSYFKLLGATYPVTVELFNSGLKVLEASSAEAGFYQRITFDKVQITTPLSEAVTWMAAPAEGGSDQLTGSVSVVDGGKARTIAGQTFLANIGVGPIAAQYSWAQLINPAASGKRVTVTRMWAGAAVAASITLLRGDAALTTLFGTGVSKYAGVGATSSAQLRSQNSASGLGTGADMVVQMQPASQSMPIELDEPLVLDAGRGVVLYPSVVNTTINASFEFTEEAV